MSGLRTYPAIQAALDDMDGGHRDVGWSILAALARAQLVENRSVVLDGVARAAQREQCGALARDVGAWFVVITTTCSDSSVHGPRIVGRRRLIPNWYELRWEEVERAVAVWEHVEGDLDLDAAEPGRAGERGCPAPLPGGPVDMCEPLVLVTGLPGSGKTTLAVALARKLDLPLIGKDQYKEILFEVLGVGDMEWSRRIGQAAIALQYDAMSTVRSAVVDSALWTGVSEPEVEALGLHLIQLHCRCPFEVARAAVLRPGSGRESAMRATGMRR